MQAGRPSQAGFTYVWVLAAVAIIGIGLAEVGTVWSRDAQRERESELLRVGQQYAAAIASYYSASPIGSRQFPPSLEALLEDRRGGSLRRHLRKLYDDPAKPGSPWGLVRGPDGSVRGVYSTNDETPMRQVPLSTDLVTAEGMARYSQWKFMPRVAAWQ